MSSDDTSPATKKGVSMIMEMMGQMMQRIQNNEESIQGMADKVYDRVMPEVHLLIETLRHDVLDAKKRSGCAP